MAEPVAKADLAAGPLRRRGAASCPLPNFAAIRVVASDMDGTFLLPSHDPPPENLDAFREVEALGIHTLLCTGRNRASAQARLPMLDLSARPGVFLNGAVVYGKAGSVIHERTVGSDVIVDLLRHIRERSAELSLVLCRDDEHAVADVAEAWAMHLHKVYDDPAPVSLGGYDAALARFGAGAGEADERPAKVGRAAEPHVVHVIGAVEGLDAARPVLERLAGERVKMVRALPTCLTLLHPLCSKADGLAAALREFQCTVDEAIAFGDAENDLEMLQAVRLGVAMDNAMQKVKDSVDWHGPSNAAKPPGVAQVLRHLTAARSRESLA